ncbi:MAG: hypothetical protein HY047_05395 [Acidobacteria bacterium]|nr:hypothetical protein [Acidobacteriota bacterium]
MKDRWTRVGVAFIVAAALVGLATVHQYGATWDEEIALKQGATVITWYKTGFADRSAIDQSNYRLYGGLFNVFAQAARAATGSGLYEASHALSLAFGLVSVALALWIGSRLGGALAGCLSAVFLWMTPVYYGHAFNNPKDIPFAVLSLAAFAAIVASWRWLPRLPSIAWIATGLAIGSTLAVRVGGLVLFLYLAAVWAAWLAIRAADRTPQSTLGADVSALAVSGLRIVLLAWIVMVVFWPYAAIDPIRNPFDALQATAHFPDYTGTVRFEGLDLAPNHLPWTYVPVWFGVTLPEFYFVAAAIALWQTPAVIAAIVRRQADGERVVLVLTLVLQIVFPLATAIALRSSLYDGIRHFLFVVPLLAIGAGIAVASFLQSGIHRAVRGSVGALIAVSIVMTCADMIRLHPYQSVYFNRVFGGGVAAAAERFDTDYWGQSYREGVEWLMANYRPDAAEPVRVANCSKEFLTGYYIDATPAARGRFVSVPIEQSPQIVLATTRWSCQEQTKGRVLHVVSRLGAPLCYVIEVAPPARGTD